MMFTYPAVFTLREEGAGFHVEFPDLEYCVVDGSDLEDAVESARYAAYDWLWVELEEGTYDSPSQSHCDDITLERSSFIKYIMVTVKLISGSN